MNKKIVVKGLLLFTIMLLQTSISYSQIINSYGFKIGSTISSIKVKEVQHIVGNSLYVLVPDQYNGQLISPAITAWAKIVDTELLSLEIEVSYLYKGSSNSMDILTTSPDNPDGTGNKEKYKYSQTLKYIQIGINPQIKYNFGGIIAYGIVGPTISYLVDYENTLMIKDKRTDLTFGYNFGLGIDFSNVWKGLFIEAKYNGDFTEFYNFESKMSGSSISYELWNKVFLINIGYRL